MLDTGFRPAEIALDLGVARQTAYEWKAVFDAQGLAGAKAKPHPGPGKNITTEQLEEFKTMILQGALFHGFPSNNWTCARAAALIETTFGLTYTADHVGAMMKELGLSPQKLATFTTTNASAAAKKLEIPVQYSCPSDLAAYDSGYGYIDIYTCLPIVHSTGLTDDFGTPKDPNDDQPQLELAYVYFIVHCQLPPGPRLSITEDPELIVVAAGNPFTVHFDLANTGEGTLTYRVDGTGMLNDLKLGSIGSNQTTRLYLSGTCPNEGDITRSRSAIATISSNAPSLNNSGSLGFNVYCFPPDPVPYFLEPFYGYLYNTFSIELHNAGGRCKYRYSTPMRAQLTSDGVHIIPEKFATLTPITDAALFSNDGYYWRFDGTLKPVESNTFRFDITCEVRGYATIDISAYTLDRSKGVSKEYGIACDPSKRSGTPGEVVPIGSP